MVCYNDLDLPLQWKSTHRSQASKRVCVLVRFYLWTLQLELAPSILFSSMLLMTRLMLAVFLNSIVHLICLLFCSETRSLTEPTGSARLLTSEPQGDLPVSASTTPELQAYPCAATSGTFHGFWGCQLSLSCLCDKHSPD